MSIVQMGYVTAPSGVLLVIDSGYLSFWSHDRKPVMPDGIMSTQEATDFANTFVDLHIVGRDAEQAGVLLDWSWHPLYAFDQAPTPGRIWTRLDEIVAEHMLDAHLEVLPERVSHRKRVDLAMEYGKGAGEVQFHGPTAVAVGDVPRDRRLIVIGERMPDSDRWRQVIVECRQGSVDVTEHIGRAAVDYARLMLADVDALGAWEHEEPLDGLADYVFWGKDAGDVAAKYGAPLVEEGIFGWLNLPVEEASSRGIAIEEYRDENELKFAVDFRPHSDNWRLLDSMRRSSTDSETTEVGGATVCGFWTLWGDGFFDVSRDLDASGSLLRIRIDFEMMT